jgi:hypothetical protein
MLAMATTMTLLLVRDAVDMYTSLGRHQLSSVWEDGFATFFG